MIETRKFQSGLVTGRSGNAVWVDSYGELVRCTIPKKFDYQSEIRGGVVTGDQVEFKLHPPKSSNEKFREGSIQKVETRTNVFLRGNPWLKSYPQGIAANIDLVFVVCAVRERTTPFGLVDRIVAAASQVTHAETVILWNKTDLLEDVEFASSEFHKIYTEAGFQSLGISVRAGEIGDLIDRLKGKRSLMIGASGVGKSSLLNLIDPTLSIRTMPVSSYSGKGVHTTTVSSLYTLPFGGELIDTPGVKTVSLDGVLSSSIDAFTEFHSYLGHCRFSDCRHRLDAGCAIREASESGEIAASRYQSFIEIGDEIGA